MATPKGLIPVTVGTLKHIMGGAGGDTIGGGLGTLSAGPYIGIQLGFSPKGPSTFKTGSTWDLCP